MTSVPTAPITDTSFKEIFHQEIAQHNQCYFYNRLHNLEILIKQDKQNYLPLNEANILLGRCCKSIIKNYTPNNDQQAILIAEIEHLMVKWKQLFKSGGPFDTYQFAAKIFDNFNLLNLDMKIEMEKFPDVLQAFKNVPAHIKYFFQFNLIIEEEILPRWCYQITQAFKQESSLFYYVREMTIHDRPIEPHSSGNNFRLIRLKLLPEIVWSRHNPALIECTKLLCAVTNPLLKNTIALPVYAEQIAPNIYLSQGNTNYKKFLALLGIIHTLYQEKDNYAYTL